MVVSPRFLRHSLGGFAAATLSVALVGGVAGAALAQASGADPARPLNQATNSLSIAYGKQLMAEASAAIADQNFPLAEEKLTLARESFNQLSTYYQELAQMFVGVDTLLNRSNREKALETAQLRDQASYQLALVYRAQNQPDDAVPLLMEILRSQQPTRDLGQRAYQQLYELGFVDAPYAGQTATFPEEPVEEEVIVVPEEVIVVPEEVIVPEAPIAPEEPTTPSETLPPM
jgi:thioredoxin-like negative regulator of GroEL